jgi:ribosomal-protein-alanine N-acetyltransferase
MLFVVMVMEMPYEPSAEAEAVVSSAALAEIELGDWRNGLPTLTGARVTLREVRQSDAASLFAALLNEEVTRFISPPPPTMDGLERFIAWTHRQRAAGQSVCFAIVPHGSDAAIGLFQVRLLNFRFRAAEWGFVMASEYWGDGLFGDAARLIIDFAFDVIGSRRLEARVAVKNSRGNAALRKLGAVREGLLRKSFLRNGEFFDQSLWTILVDEWREAIPTWHSPSIH